MRYKEKNNNKKIVKQGFIQGVIMLIFSQIIIKILGLAYKLYLTNKDGFGDAGNAIYSAGFRNICITFNFISYWCTKCSSKNDFRKSFARRPKRRT